MTALIASAACLAAQTVAYPSKVVLPQYPRTGMFACVVTLSVSVSSTGDVLDVGVSDAPPGGFSKAAFERVLHDSIYQWKYPPRQRDWKTTVRFTYDFFRAAEPKRLVIFEAPSDVYIRRYGPVDVATGDRAAERKKR